MAKEIDVTVSKDGMKVSFDAKNFEGGSCQDFLGSIMKGIGEIEEEKKKPEFHLKPRQSVRG